MTVSKFKIQNFFFVFCLLPFVSLFGCVTGSMPNLDKPECAESRDVVKKFYSIHFAGEMYFSQESLSIKEKFLTPEFIKELKILRTENDVFTTDSDDIPRAFRLGGCQILEPTKTNIEILLLWKNEREIRQQNIKAEVVKVADSWLINKILR